MKKASITIALENEQVAEKIKLACQRSGYLVGDVCTSGSEAIRRVRTEASDILLINFEMPDMTGLEVATIAGEENLCSVVLLVSQAQRDFAADMAAGYDITLFVKTLGGAALMNMLEVVLQNRRRIRKLEDELARLKRGMEERKVIEKARGILMMRKGISEGEAYRRIQKMSMDSRVAMRDIAVKIIEMAQKETRED